MVLFSGTEGHWGTPSLVGADLLPGLHAGAPSPPAEPQRPRWSDGQLLELKAMGASHRQVAEASGMTYRAVATRLYRTRRRPSAEDS